MTPFYTAASPEPLLLDGPKEPPCQTRKNHKKRIGRGQHTFSLPTKVRKDLLESSRHGYCGVPVVIVIFVPVVPLPSLIYASRTMSTKMLQSRTALA